MYGENYHSNKLHLASIGDISDLHYVNHILGDLMDLSHMQSPYGMKYYGNGSSMNTDVVPLLNTKIISVMSKKKNILCFKPPKTILE